MSVPDEILALAPWIEAKIPSIGQISSFTKFSDGQSNPTYLVVGQGGKYVLRTQPRGQLLRGAHLLDREYRVMSSLKPAGIAVPQMVVFSDADGSLGRQFYIMRYVDGDIYWNPSLPDHSARERGKIYDEMNKALVQLHGLSPGAVGLGDFSRTGAYFERQLRTWSRQYHLATQTPSQDMLVLEAWLGKNLPPEDHRLSVVHGDFRLDNLIFDPQTQTLRAILDWELSSLGHPFADLAYQCMQWRLPHEGVFPGLSGLNRLALGIPSEEEYIKTYCHRAGIAQIENWKFYIAFSFFRLASILQGVLSRAAAGNASNAQSAQRYGILAPLLAELGVVETVL